MEPNENQGDSTFKFMPTPFFPRPPDPNAGPLPAPVETPGKKRGRPRKYDRNGVASSALVETPREKRDKCDGNAASSSSRMSPLLAALADRGQGFTTHFIMVNAGEDVHERLTMFRERTTRKNVCILSASGSIAYVSLRQPGGVGDIITFMGQFEILSLSGCYVCDERGGESGGLSVSLSNLNIEGQIIGGLVDEPLVAARPIQVIVGTFVCDRKKDVASPVGANMDSSGMRGNDYHPTIDFADDHQTTQLFGVDLRRGPVKRGNARGRRGEVALLSPQKS